MEMSYNCQENLKMEEKMVPTIRISQGGITLIFKNLISPWFLLAEKNVQIKEYCFKQTRNGLQLEGTENLFKNTFLLHEKTAYIGRNI